jgi:hypothetical protein
MLCEPLNAFGTVLGLAMALWCVHLAGVPGFGVDDR